MKDYRKVNDHVFEGGQAHQDVDPAEVALATAIRDALKSSKVPECRLGVEHLRNRVLDRSSRSVVSRLPWGWLGSGFGVAVAAGLLVAVQTNPPKDVPQPAESDPTNFVAVKESVPTYEAELPKTAVESTTAASQEAVVAPALESDRKPRRTRRAPSKGLARDETLVALAEPSRVVSASAVPESVSGGAAEADPVETKPADPVVIVVQPSPGHGRAVEVGLGQDVLFGG